MASTDQDGNSKRVVPPLVIREMQRSIATSTLRRMSTQSRARELWFGCFAVQQTVQRVTKRRCHCFFGAQRHMSSQRPSPWRAALLVYAWYVRNANARRYSLPLLCVAGGMCKSKWYLNANHRKGRKNVKTLSVCDEAAIFLTKRA